MMPIIEEFSDAERRLRRAQSLTGSSEGRAEHDFYPTPPEAVEALLRVETLHGTLWEPACGDGAICKVLEAHGHRVIATDLIDRGWGEGGRDFLHETQRVDSIVTNPPFTLASSFIEHALGLTSHKVAMLCKLQFLEGGRRKAMFENTPLARVWVFSKRLSMTRDGKPMKNSGMIAFAWYVWEHGYRGPAQIGWL